MHHDVHDFVGRELVLDEGQQFPELVRDVIKQVERVPTALRPGMTSHEMIGEQITSIISRTNPKAPLYGNKPSTVLS